MILGLNNCPLETYSKHKNIKIVSANFDNNVTYGEEGNARKLAYLKVLPLLWRTIREFRPDVVHAHYASSYGLLGALTWFKPFVVSVWGSDIYTFPRRSLLHSWLIKFVLFRAGKVLSTSHAMASETRKYTQKSIVVTPFGIDLQVFKPTTVSSLFSPSDIVVGTVKTLEEKYGIEYLIRAFHQVRSRNPDLPLKLLIVGGGTLEEYLKKLVAELNLGDCTVFTGRVPFEAVQEYHNMLSVYVALSVCDSESFGVAILESGACAKPVIVWNVGGLPEVVEDGVTGIVVPVRDIDATVAAIESLVLDEELRQGMGRAGRARVQCQYDWNSSVGQMITIYEDLFKIRDLQNDTARRRASNQRED